MTLIVPLMDDLSNRAANQVPMALVSPRSKWQRGIPISGTVNSIAAATESLTPNALYAAALADTAGTLRASLKTIQVPANCTYLELGAFGDGAIGTAPVLELYRSNHPNTNAGGGTGVGVPIPAGEEDWSRLLSLLGNVQTTLSTTANDITGAAGANRYQLDEATYQNCLFDVRGARLIVVRLITAGSTGNWSLWHRFF